MIQFIHRHLSFATPYSFGVDQLQGSATICFVTSCGQWQPVATTERIPSRQIEESISILNFFPPNRGVDFYFELLRNFRRLPSSRIFHLRRRRRRRHPPPATLPPITPPPAPAYCCRRPAAFITKY
jgi:hypothetical protein